MGSTGKVVRYMAWTTLLVMLAVLFVNSLGGTDLSNYGIPTPSEDANEPSLLVGIILVSTGIMILTETVFTRNFPELDNPRSINFVLGIPSGIIAILVGFSWSVGYAPVIDVLGPTLNGVYLSGLIILLYEGLVNQVNAVAET